MIRGTDHLLFRDTYSVRSKEKLWKCCYSIKRLQRSSWYVPADFDDRL